MKLELMIVHGCLTSPDSFQYCSSLGSGCSSLFVVVYFHLMLFKFICDILCFSNTMER
jgi:hypothetical protein